MIEATGSNAMMYATDETCTVTDCPKGKSVPDFPKSCLRNLLSYHCARNFISVQKQTQISMMHLPNQILGTGILKTKLQEILRIHPNNSTKDVLRVLSNTDTEGEHVERTTTKQWQCEERSLVPLKWVL